MSRDEGMSRERGKRLRFALRAYPRKMRRTEGAILTSLARDLVDDGQSSTNREALGLLRGGLVARAGVLAELPWQNALRRIALPVAVALLAVSLGTLAFWMGAYGLAWPGWSWLAVITGPALALLGLLAGWRLPLVAGGALVCLLGVAEGNGLLLNGPLEATASWTTGGFDLPFLGAVIPAGLLFLAASLCPGRRASLSTVLATSAWAAVGAIAARILYPQYVTLDKVDLNGLGICLTAYGLTIVGLMAIGTARRRRDPAGMLAGVLGLATILPVLLLYGVSSIPLGDNALLLLLALSALATTAFLIRLVKRIPT